jgi:diadenosine tetraphosphate (Ap4A) HIT family hydrolase
MTEWGASELSAFDRRKFLEGADNGTIACPFCLELETPAYALNFLEHWPFADRILFTTDLATAIAGYGPQVRSYALIIPHRHLRSVAETSREERESLMDCLDALRSLESYPSGVLTVFEHGDCGSRQHHSCIEHCHLHVMDGSIRMADWLREECRGCEEAVLSSPSVWRADSGYLWAGTYTGDRRAIGLMSRSGSDRSQFFRRLIARRMGHAKWNWREGMNPSYMRELVSAAKAQNVGR